MADVFRRIQPPICSPLEDEQEISSEEEYPTPAAELGGSGEQEELSHGDRTDEEEESQTPKPPPSASQGGLTDPNPLLVTVPAAVPSKQMKMTQPEVDTDLQRISLYVTEASRLLHVKDLRWDLTGRFGQSRALDPERCHKMAQEIKETALPRNPPKVLVVEGRSMCPPRRAFVFLFPCLQTTHSSHWVANTSALRCTSYGRRVRSKVPGKTLSQWG